VRVREKRSRGANLSLSESCNEIVESECELVSVR
jgi:hypothetical protein